MDRSPLGIWLVRLVALAALFAGRRLLVPGVDGEAVESMRHAAGPSASLEVVSLFSGALLPLLVVSLVLLMLASSDPVVSERRQRIGAIVYLGWCALWAYSQALEKRLAEAQRVADALRSEPLQCDWQTASLDALGPK